MQNIPNEFTHSEKPTRFIGVVDAIDGNKKPTIIKMQIDANDFDINRTVYTVLNIAEGGKYEALNFQLKTNV